MTLRRWYHRWMCWVKGHGIVINTGILRTYTGNWSCKQCLWCGKHWREPMPNFKQKPL